MSVIQILQQQYGYNNPILLSELNINNMKTDAIRQSLTRLAKEGKIERCAQGVYYIPSVTALGKSKISAKKIYERKYIYNEKDVYGFYSGLTLKNAVGITTQMPNVVEIVTNKEKSRVREVSVAGQIVRLRSSKIEITKKNVKVLQLLDLLNQVRWNELSDRQKKLLFLYIRQQKINSEELYEYIGKYPSRVAKNVIESRLLDELGERQRTV